ncbi:hypothetical protein SNE40_021170 [Patella caerulea]|uniref:AAA+ ATPase domain-containing protein n=1 Tax=Patella caerulea TaxID=87958 RepID=A0AAN8FYX6_PATCE
MDVRLKWPFTCMISGPTQSGKSHLVRRLILELRQVVDQPVDRIVWCYGVWQPLYAELSGSIEFVEGLGVSLNPRERTLLIIDDLMDDTSDKVSKLFTRGSHHENASVIYIVQNLFHKGKHHRTISLNAHYMIIFKNPRDVSAITQLAKQMYPGKTKFVRESYEDATQKPYSYLFLDLKSTTPDILRLRNSIFPSDNPTVYVPKV